MLIRPDRRRIELLGVDQHALLGFELFIFAGNEYSLLDLLALVGPEIGHAEAVLLAFFELGQLANYRLPLVIGIRYGMTFDMRKAVKQKPLLGLVKAGKRFGLR